MLASAWGHTAIGRRSKLPDRLLLRSNLGEAFTGVSRLREALSLRSTPGDTARGGCSKLQPLLRVPSADAPGDSPRAVNELLRVRSTPGDPPLGAFTGVSELREALSLRSTAGDTARGGRSKLQHLVRVPSAPVAGEAVGELRDILGLCSAGGVSQGTANCVREESAVQRQSEQLHT